MADCTACELHRSRTQVVFPTPAGPSGLVAIGEAPGADEDRLGEGFVGRAGKTLDAELARHAIGRADYGRANICWCRPPDNRKPKPVERATCLTRLEGFFLTQPRGTVVLAVGGTPAGEFYPSADSLGAMIALAARRDHVPELAWARDRGLRVVPMPHTSPLAWNRKAPDGTKWSEVGARQIALAVGLRTRGDNHVL
jgi:DNA polymerase